MKTWFMMTDLVFNVKKRLCNNSQNVVTMRLRISITLGLFLADIDFTFAAIESESASTSAEDQSGD